jgi:hypothetical protein
MFETLLIVALAGTAAFDAETIPKAQSDIATACGTRPNLAVRWKAFGDDEPAAQALIGSKLTFLTTALTTVCKDAAAKTEMANQVRKIVLTQAHGAADPVIYISEGTLNVEYLWVKGEPAPDANFVAAEIASRLKGEEAEAP